MPRILITGASGLLGINLALEAAKEHTVYGQVHQQQLNLRAAPSAQQFKVIQADLLAPQAVPRLLEETQPDWVIHCAALANLDACEADPAQAEQLNTNIPLQLAEYVARGGARLLHVSTDAVFDGQRGGYTEDDPPNPLSVYARTKLAGEQAVAAANPQAIIARVNLFGWSLRGNRSLAEFFFTNLSQGRSVMGFTDVFFCPLLANHLARIFLEMLRLDLHGLYHVVGSQCLSKYQFGLEIARRFGLDENLIQPASVFDGGLRAARSPNLTLSNARLVNALQTRSQMMIPSLSTGLDDFYTLYQQGYPQLLHSIGAEAAHP